MELRLSDPNRHVTDTNEGALMACISVRGCEASLRLKEYRSRLHVTFLRAPCHAYAVMRPDLPKSLIKEYIP